MDQSFNQKQPASLEELLQQCTVKLTLPELHQHGTGFFVAPNLILTCNHVVSGSAKLKCPEGRRVKVRWQDQENFVEAEVIKSCVDPVDLALLSFKQVSSTQVPYVYFDTKIEHRQNLYSFGYPDKDFPNGFPVTLTYVGLTGDKPPYMIFNREQIRRGMSGAALLNQDTRKVCGIVKFTRDAGSDLGGGGVSAQTILSELPELIQYQNVPCQKDDLWTSFLINGNIDRNTLLERLRSCPAGIFRVVMSFLRPPAGTLSSENSAQATRAAELIEWAEHPDGCGLEEVQKAYLRAIGKSKL